MKRILIMSIITAWAATSPAEIVVDPIDYTHDGVELEGILVYDDSNDAPKPGVLIFHQWSGAGEYETARATMLAAEGYAVFAGDIYGKGIRPVEVADKRANAGIYYSDRALARARARAALATMKAMPQVDAGRIVAIGYCFGGMIALELARDGAEIAGFVSIHGSLGNPSPDDTRNIKGAVLVQHGAADPLVPAADLAALHQEMIDADIDYRVTEYADAVHSFTDWNAGDDPSNGVAYNQRADELSWQELLTFLRQYLSP